MLDDVFLFNPKNAYVFTGEKFRDMGFVVYAIVVGVGFLVGLFLLSQASASSELDAKFQNTGVVTTAEYVDKTIETSRRTSDESTRTTTYYLIYEYVVDDIQYQGRHRTSQGVYNDFEAGGELSILYLPDEPHLSIAGTERSTTDTTFTTVMGILVMGICILAWGVLYVKSERTYDPKKDGELMTGELTSVKIEPSANGDRAKANVTYMFDSPQTGESIEDDAIRYLKGDQLNNPPQSGTRVALLVKQNNLKTLL